MSGISKRVSGSWVSGDYGIMKTATDTITTLPADLYADGNNATVGLVGNMSQTGTPTPQNPIQPQETGERTGNLFDVTGAQSGYITADGTVISGHDNLMYTDYIAIPDGETYITQSYGGSLTAMNAPALCFYDSAKTYISGEAFGNVYDKTFTVPNGAVYIRTCYRTTMSWVMLNIGSTALPHEPNGIKIPILSAGQTTNVYLGEVQSTRKIYKYEITGNETFTQSTNPLYYIVTLPEAPLLRSELYSTHFVAGGSDIAEGACRFAGTEVAPDSRLIFNYDNGSGGIASFKLWAAQQYANGTPVVVYYVLATPATGIVNEPLRKIGEYADTVSGITIPTIAGADSFDVLTTLKPSEVTVNYHGWHTGTVHERESGSWD